MKILCKREKKQQKDKIKGQSNRENSDAKNIENKNKGIRKRRIEKKGMSNI